MNKKTKQKCSNKLTEKYAEALNLYRETSLSQKAICEQCNVSTYGFRSYIQKYCREDLMKRHNIKGSTKVKLHSKKGQGINAHNRYREAVAACDSEEFITYSVYQIAKYYRVSPSGLGNQLRMHFPEILERRRRARTAIGLKNHMQETVVAQHAEMYREAVNLLSSGDLTIREAASQCGVSFSGLRQHLMFYHKELSQKRLLVREANRQQTTRGLKNGNNVMHKPLKKTDEKYAEALNLYISTSMTISEIVRIAKVSEPGFCGYLRKWFPEQIDERSKYVSTKIEGKKTSEANLRYRKSVALKYADAIQVVRKDGVTIAEAARMFNLNADVFRKYLKKHYPQIASTKGMFISSSGKRMSRNSYEKYKDAIECFIHSDENLHSIAIRMNLDYNSLLYFVKRNFPDALEK